MALKQKKLFLLLSILSLFIIAQSIAVLALGVSPGRVTLKFVPGAVYDGKVCFYPDGIAHFKLETIGELKPYIILTEDELYIDGESGCINYKVKMPKSFDRPGTHEGGITAVELMDEGGSSNIAVLVKIIHQIWIESPYPGKYLAVKLSAKNVKAGEQVPFKADITSKGNLTINSAQGTIIVYDNKNETIGTVKTNTQKNILTDETRVLSAVWDSTGYKDGNYHATIFVDYDGEKRNASTDFKLGGLNVNLVNYTREVVIGGIKQFSVIAESMWGEILNTKATVNVLSQNDSSTVLTSFDTLTQQLEPWSVAYLNGYIDTSSLALGEYPCKIVLTFEGKQKEYDGAIKIIKEVSPELPKTKRSPASTLKILIFALGGLLLVMIIIFFFLLMPKKKAPAEKGK